MPFELVGRADAREQQYVGRPDRAGAQDDLASEDLERLSPALHDDADGPVALHQQPVDETVALEREVQPVSRLAQVPDVGAPPDAFRVIERRRAHAGRVGVVVVGAVWVSGGPARLVESPLVIEPLRLLEAPYYDGPVGAVEVVPKVGVRLQLAEEGEHIAKAPALVARGGPAVVVLRNAPEEYLGVDRAGAADELAPGDQYLRGLVGGPGDQVPAVGAVLAERLRPDVPASTVAVPDLLRQVFELRVVGARFEQQYRAPRVFRQPGGDHRARGPGPDDDRVVDHVRPPA